MNAILQNAAAIPDLKGQQDERYPILGDLIWYSLRDVRITRQDLENLFTKHGISHAHLPAEIREADAYRRATSDINTRQPRQLQDGTYEVLMVREVASNNDEIVRHLVREVRDSKNKRLSYEQVGVLNFFRANNDFHTATGRPEYQQLLNDAAARYREYLQYYTGKHIREMVHGMIITCSPTNVRPAGGVFFVSKEHEALVNGLEGLVSDLNAYATPNTNTGEAVFEVVPLLDTQKQRALIFSKYELQVSGSVDKTLQELAELLKSDKMSSDIVKTRYVEQMKELRAGIEKYEALLESDLVLARQKAEILEAQVFALLNKVAPAKPAEQSAGANTVTQAAVQGAQ